MGITIPRPPPMGGEVNIRYQGTPVPPTPLINHTQYVQLQWSVPFTIPLMRGHLCFKDTFHEPFCQNAL